MAYATPQEFDAYGLPSSFLPNVGGDIITAHLQAASDFADGFLASRFNLPLTIWGADLKRYVCSIAAYYLAGYVGMNPETNAPMLIHRYNEALDWLKGINNKTIHPNWTDSTSSEQGAFVMSDSQRGWSTRGITPPSGGNPYSSFWSPDND